MNKNKSTLRKFGLVMTVPLVIIAGLLFWKDKTTWQYFAGAAAFFFLSGLIVPIILAPIEYVWMLLAKALSVVMTFVLLTIVFYVVVTPLGLLMKLLGKDLLNKKFPVKDKSFWVPVEADGPHSRPDKPY